ncbi:MAG: chorismate mutase [Anaerolineae bacterium]|jgi:chorismate mutase|nr:chorismate mutase [Anaerolineae bacterium]MBT7073771.1 chorismate mutase [Anaerolineae bacterium]MBT7783553.1 chorismate mutase [Anaerolineae bacterium]
MPIRGIRGAITLNADTKENIHSVTCELLDTILLANPELRSNDIASAFFTTTEDVTAAYPALAARQIGWDAVPMLCAREIPVPGSLAMCIRVLIHWNTDKEQEEIKHIYLRGAVNLRPDLVNI